MNTVNPVEAYSFINAMVKEATGENATIQAIDTSTFVSCGDLLLRMPHENVLNAISTVLSRTLVDVRPYGAKLTLMDSDSMAYDLKYRKIIFRSKPALESGYFNTTTTDGSTPYKTNIAEGFDNGSNGGVSTASMWEQHHPDPVEINFASNATFQTCITITENQLKNAFTDESSFMAFINGALQEHANDIERYKENWNRTTLINRLATNVYLHQDGESDIAAGRDDYGKESMAINLTKAFNARFGTQYTSEQLKTTYLKEFLQFLAFTIKNTANRMTYSTGKFHYQYPKFDENDVKTGLVLRDTPYSRMSLLLYAPLIREGESYVFPEIFNPQYMKMENYEGVEFWQSFNEPMKINAVGSVPGGIVPSTNYQTTTNEVNVDIVGILYDKDAMRTRVGFEVAHTTPLEARKGYRNTWNTFNRGAINDYSESAVVFYMSDED